MEKGIEKLLKRAVLKKYPFYKDVRVVQNNGAFRTFLSDPYQKVYDVYLIILEKDSYDEEKYKGVGDYVEDIAKYMDTKIVGVYNDVVTEDEWEQMKVSQD